MHSYFVPISLSKLHPNSFINFDLYLETNDNFVLYKGRNLEITMDDIQRLVDNGIETFYIHKKDKKNFKNYQEGNLEEILGSDDVSVEKKAEALYDSAINVIEDVFENPRSGHSIKRSREIVGHTVDFILGLPQAFANLLKLRKHDYYTYTHSVNVCTFLVSLAQELGISEINTLKEIGEGGLLHDLGKSQVPSKLINKRGRLTKTEWEVMQKHPALGVGIARDTRESTGVTLSIIGQHHEKLSGKGYPNGLKGSELNVFANMASIVDVYDAITTNRSYSPAKPPMVAAQILVSNKEDFDEKLLLTFLKMLAVKGEHK
ncbi:MAG: HD domain-containing protein [bacterium]|nr:HD domain-containing protein [bacterium]